jgi:hypothetical protein
MHAMIFARDGAPRVSFAITRACARGQGLQIETNQRKSEPALGGRFLSLGSGSGETGGVIVNLDMPKAPRMLAGSLR